MNRTGIMGMFITLLLVTFVSSTANAYHSRRGHHNSQQISNRGSDACMLTNDGRSVCDASYRASTPQLSTRPETKPLPWRKPAASSARDPPAVLIVIADAVCANISACRCATEPCFQLGAIASTRGRPSAGTCSRAERPCHVHRVGRRQRPMADSRLQFRRRTVANACARRARLYLRQSTGWDGKGISRQLSYDVYCQILLAASTTRASFARSSASVSGLPATVLANPH